MRAEISPDASPRNAAYRVERRPDAANWPHDPPPTPAELDAAIRTLRAASFHGGWVDLNDPAELASIARGWDVDPDILRDAGRVAGWSVPALQMVYRQEQFEESCGAAETSFPPAQVVEVDVEQFPPGGA